MIDTASSGIRFNSEGKVLSKKEMQPIAEGIVMDKLLFAIWYMQDKNISCPELIEMKGLLMDKIGRR